MYYYTLNITKLAVIIPLVAAECHGSNWTNRGRQNSLNSAAYLLFPPEPDDLFFEDYQAWCKEKEVVPKSHTGKTLVSVVASVQGESGPFL